MEEWWAQLRLAVAVLVDRPGLLTASTALLIAEPGGAVGLADPRC